MQLRKLIGVVAFLLPSLLLAQPTGPPISGGGGAADPLTVLGPAAACADNQLARWNGASNTALQCSPLVVSDTTGDITAPGALTISTAGSNGDITLDPHGTGAVVVPTGNSFRLFGLGSGATDSEFLSITAQAGTSFTIAPVTDGTGADNLSLILRGAGTGTVQAPGQGANALLQVQIGPGATAASGSATYSNVAIGRNATSGTRAGIVVIGDTVTAGDFGVAIGYGVTSTQRGLALGYNANSGVVSSNNKSIAIGGDTNSSAGALGLALGYGANTTAANQAVIGGNDQFTTLYYNGVTDATPTGIVVNATGGSGTDIAGASLTLAGGKGTGNAAGGAVKIQTSVAGASGTTLQTLATRVTVGVERTTIANILSLTGIAAAPGSPAAGDIVYDSVNNLFCGYNGSAWVSFSGAGTCWAE